MKSSELGDNNQSIPRQDLPLDYKVATPYLHIPSVIQSRQPRPHDDYEPILKTLFCNRIGE